MRHINAKTVAVLTLALVVSAVSTWGAHAQSAAVRNCTWCHGAVGQGYNPAPRLAGQRREYIESQIRGFQSHLRDNPDSKQYMWGAAQFVSPQRSHYLAGYFSTVPPRAANDGLREFVASGKAIYQDGVPEANIVACIACHGPDAQGAGEIPRLAGLGYTYLKRRLVQWGEGYNAAAKHPMPSVASKLSEQQIRALASYLSFME